MSPIKLLPKQQEALEFVLARKNAALFLEQRTGKTFITLAMLQALSEEMPLCGVIIGLLNNKESTWRHRISTELPGVSIHVEWESFRDAPIPKVMLVHYEQLRSVIGPLSKYRKLNFAVVDESHKIANRTTTQSKAVSRLSWVPRKLILSGTPIEKKPMDLFAQFRFLEPSVFGTNWAKFESRYWRYKKMNFEGLRPGSNEWKSRLMQQNILKNKGEFKQELLPELIEKIKPYSIRMEQSDVGIAKPKLVPERIIAPQGLLTQYAGIHRDGLLRLADGSLVLADMAAIRVAKKRQLANGFVYDEDGELHWLSDHKIDRVAELFDELSKPVVVFTAFKSDTERVFRRLKNEKYRVAKFHGGTKKKLRPSILRKFQQAQLDGIVCQIRTGGAGVDLWKANSGIVCSMGHSFIDWDQALSRMSSIDKTHGVTIHVLITDETIDDDLYSLVLVKGLTGQMVLKHLKKGETTWPPKTKKPPKPRARRAKSKNTSTASPSSRKPPD